MKKCNHVIEFEEYNNIDELSKEDKALLLLSREAIKSSYSPYSKFSVGASVLFNNGEMLNASNQENAAYPSGMCAERVLLYYSKSKFPKEEIKAMAISAKSVDDSFDDVISPCGACRQVILEYQSLQDSDFRIILDGKKKILIAKNIHQLLPMGFTK